MTQTTSPFQAEAQAMQTKRDKYFDAIREMERHLSVAQDGTIVLGVSDPATIQVDPDAFNELSRSLHALNQHLRTGLVHPSQIRMKTEVQAPTILDGNVRMMVTCAGIEYFAVYWWGMRLWTNECVTQAIIGSMQGAGGAAAIAAAIMAVPPATPGALAMGIASGILQLAAGLLQIIDGLGGNHGLEFSVTWLFIVSWVWHQ